MITEYSSKNNHLNPNKCKYSFKKCNVELNLSLNNPILPAWHVKYQAVITSLSWENYLIVIKLLINDSYKHIHFLYYVCMSQQLPYTHTNTHTQGWRYSVTLGELSAELVFTVEII